MYYNIQIVRVGMPVINFTAAPGSTFKSVLEANGIPTTGVSIRFRGTSVDLSRTIDGDGDLLISKAIAGAA